MRYFSEALDQYTGICKEALQDCASKLSKSFESVIIEVLRLYMVIPGKINFTQMGIVAASASISIGGCARLGQEIRLCNIGWSMNVFPVFRTIILPNENESDIQ